MNPSVVPAMRDGESSPDSSTVGILAGNGVYPGLLARRLASRKMQVIIAGIFGQTEPAVAKDAELYQAFPLGAIKKTARFFLKQGARQIFFAGGLRRKGALKHARPDACAMVLAVRAFTSGDDRFLRNLAICFLKYGIEVIDPSPYIGDLFAQVGRLAGPDPRQSVIDSLAVAWRAALRTGSKDRGQAALAKGDHVWAVERKDGTDALIAKARGAGGVLAKVVKPGQDRRFDMPAIGPESVERAHTAGLAAIGVQAHGVLLLEKERIFDACNRHHISLIGYLSPGPAFCQTCEI